MFPFGLCGCLWVIFVGGTAGFLVGQVVRGRGYNPVGNVLLGIAGFYVGTLFFGELLHGGICGAVLVSCIGALVLIFGVRVFIDEDFAK